MTALTRNVRQSEIAPFIYSLMLCCVFLETPAGTLPVLEIGDQMFGESAAIANWAARKFGTPASPVDVVLVQFSVSVDVALVQFSAPFGVALV